MESNKFIKLGEAKKMSMTSTDLSQSSLNKSKK